MRFLRTIVVAGALAAYALQAAPARAEGTLRRFTIGDLHLDLDPGSWTVERSAESWSIRWPEERIEIDVTMTAGPPALCTPAKMAERAREHAPDAWEIRETTLVRLGVELHAATLDYGCRNLAGSPVFACAAYTGNIYSFTATAGGCPDTPYDYDGKVLEALATLSGE